MIVAIAMRESRIELMINWLIYNYLSHAFDDDDDSYFTLKYHGTCSHITLRIYEPTDIFIYFWPSVACRRFHFIWKVQTNFELNGRPINLMGMRLCACHMCGAVHDCVMWHGLDERQSTWNKELHHFSSCRWLPTKCWKKGKKPRERLWKRNEQIVDFAKFEYAVKCICSRLLLHNWTIFHHIFVPFFVLFCILSLSPCLCLRLHNVKL